VILEFCDSRGEQAPREKLVGFRGTIQSDAYEVYRALKRKNPALERHGCLAHARRKFYQALEESFTEAVWFIEQIRQLYRIEDQVRGLSPAERQIVRQQQAPPIWEALRKRAQLQPQLLPQSTLGKAVHYFLKEYQALTGYLRDGRFQIDKSGRERHPASRRAAETMVVYWPSAGRMAQRGDLLDLDQLSATGPQSGGISHGCAGAPALDEDQPNPRAASQPVETALGEYLLKGGSRFGLCCGGHEESVHGQTGSVPGFHLLLQQNPRMRAFGGRNPAVLSRLSASRASDDLDARSARPHRANTRTGSVHPSADPTRGAT